MSDSPKTAEKKLGKKAKVILTVLGLLVLIGVCSLVVALYAKTLITEGTVELESEPAASMSALPEDAQQSIDYLNRLLAAVKDTNRVYADVGTRLSIDDNSISFDAAQADTEVLKFVKNSMLSAATEKYPSHSGSFADGYPLLPAIFLDATGFESWSFAQGVADDEGNVTDDDYYYFNLATPAAEYPVAPKSALYDTFGMAETAQVIEWAEQELSPMLTVKSCEVVYNCCEISGKVNRLNDQLQNITVSRSCTVTAGVEFTGDYATLGEKNLSFDYRVEESYSFTWAGISFAENTCNLKAGGEESLAVNAVIDKAATQSEYSLTFKSSDESVAAVDENGVVKGIGVSSSPAIITVTLDYLGVTYEDECEVYVTVPVERIKVSPAKLAMQIGDTQRLECAVGPETATITEVLWFTENPKVALVDEYGVVAAVSAGETKVYAVSKDGNFRASCVVTITERGGV